MRIPFSKYHGAGNDFILLHAQYQTLFNQKEIERLCDRHMGIGADGLIFLAPSDNLHIEMVYHNSDGNEASMCGNGGRCAVAFAHSAGWTNESIILHAFDGDHPAAVLSRNKHNWDIELKMSDTGVPTQSGDDFFIDTGSPHLIHFVKDLFAFDVSTVGANLCHAKAFVSHDVNVNFVEESSGLLKARTFERGVEAETLACGTGVTAVALVDGFRHNRLGNNETKVVMPGGDLMVRYFYDGQRFSDIWLRGPVVHVFDGMIDRE